MSRNYAVLALSLSLAPAFADSVTERQKHDLEVFLKTMVPSRSPLTGRMNAIDRTWEEWVKRTGALPPDFASMRSIPELPDPLIMYGGGRDAPVRTPADWARQKAWMRAQFEQWVFGKMPPAPGNLRGVVTATRTEGQVTVRDVRLEFGPGHRGVLRVQLMIPPGSGPFPVFLTNHPRTRPWVNTAVRRGYIGCIYFAADPYYGNDDDSDRFIELYPEYDFSCLARWAWSAMRAVDYLYTLPEVDKKKIGLSGHSRNGKQALLAAAFDERIGAVIPSSGNTGECDPWRFTTDMYANESIQLLAGAQPHWFQPRLRFFAGREDKLPVDQHMLMALTAPRGLLIYSGYAESACNPLGFEQAYRSAKRVYRFLGHEENIWLHLRDGEHATAAGDIENFIDFLDSVFGRKPMPKSETWIHGYTYEGWREVSGETADPMKWPRRVAGDALKPVANAAAWEPAKAAIRKNLTWALGQEPAGIQFPVRHTLTGGGITSSGWLAGLFERPANANVRMTGDGMGVVQLPYGDDLEASLFYPVTANGKPKPGKWPVVIWMHPYTYQNGWSAGTPWTSGRSPFARQHRPTFSELVQRGFAVLAFDQIGFGTRVLDGRQFYERYPHWSLMGKMIADTRAAIDAVAALETVDAKRIYVMGFALGAKVGLLTAAFDGRIQGLAAICGMDTLRSAAAAKTTEGIRHYSHLHGLLPRLGAFVGHEDRAPFDYDEVLALVAPRPALIVAPSLDRYAPVDGVRAQAEAAGRIYRVLGREGALTFETPEDINRFPPPLQTRVFDWLAQLQ